MRSLHIRDVEETILERLKLLARLHHRSVQGEIRAILEEASRLAPMHDQTAVRPLSITTVSAGNETASWDRQEIYGDDAR
jgi:plasmid stability protein